MLYSYLKIAWRGLAKHRTYSFINISGLAVGMAVSLLIGLWIHYEFSYDRFLPDFDRIYQVKRHYTTDQIHTDNAVSLPLVDIFKQEIPGVQYAAEADWGGTDHSLLVGDTRLYLSGTFTGSDFLNVFQFPLLQGNHQTALLRPDGIVLTASTARALFGEEDAMNRSIRFDQTHELTVTGVLNDLPANSTLQFNYLVPFAFLEKTQDYVKHARTDWGSNAFSLFVRLAPEVKDEKLAAQIKHLLTENSEKARATKQELSLQAFKDRHLYNKYENGKAAGGYIEYIHMFGLIGILVLLIACINFMNLTTARSLQKAKEVGVRKAIGSKRKQLIFQFLSESLLYTSLSFILALLLTNLSLLPFNRLMGGEVRVPFENPSFWLIMMAYLILTALLAGGRPAFYLSSFNAVQVLKGSMQRTRSAFTSRKALVLVQFSCSIGLVISTLIIYQQLQHVKNRPVGYDQHRLLVTDMSEDMIRNYPVIKEELLNSGLVENVARSSSSATDITFYSEINKWPGKLADVLPLGIAAITVSDTYFETMGMHLKSGRNFGSHPSTDSNSVILNEAAVQQLGIADPVGQSITWMEDQQVVIVGVVADAIMESPFQPAEPTLFTPNGFWNSVIYRLAPQLDFQDALTYLKPIFEKNNPSYPFEYEFVDDAYAQKFQLEVTISRLASLFAGLAIFVSCLGLFGLATYMAEQRRKEIGIRKVLGATVAQLWLMLSKEFLLLVFVSCLLAAPVALYFAQNWLQQYDYRITITPVSFIIAGLLAMIITFLTVSFQAIRVGTARPVDSLRSE